MNRPSIAALCLLVGALSSSTQALARDDVQAWPSVNLSSSFYGALQASLYSQLRYVDDVQTWRLTLLSPGIRYRINPDLSVRLNYTYIETRSDSETAWQHRYQIEAGHTWQMASAWTLLQRPRVEWRWIEGAGSDNTRLRYLWELTRKLMPGCWLDGVYVSDEIFYEFNRRKMTENRWIPLGLIKDFNSQSQVRIYYMLRCTKSSTDRNMDHVLGSQFSYQF